MSYLSVEHELTDDVELRHQSCGILAEVVEYLHDFIGLEYLFETIFN
jgi:hypothetical protein